MKYENPDIQIEKYKASIHPFTYNTLNLSFKNIYIYIYLRQNIKKEKRKKMDSYAIKKMKQLKVL